MQSDLKKSLIKQAKIPIIGKGNYAEILDKINYLIKQKYKIIEITLRSKDALEISLNVKNNFPDLIIGIGSIISYEQLKDISKHKFHFYISPGINTKMMEMAYQNNLNYIPGISSASEVMKALEHEYELLKFFPAEQSGGINVLKYFSDIFQNVKFIPTGGINKNNIQSYLDLPNVIGVGSTNF